MRFACGETMRNPVRLFGFFVGLCCVCLSSLALAWEHWGGDRGGSRFSARLGEARLGEARLGEIRLATPPLEWPGEFQSPRRR
jgi:hypothetical protein